MHLVQFSMYYLTLRLSTLLRFTETTLPLGMNWRYFYWQRKIRYQTGR